MFSLNPGQLRSREYSINKIYAAVQLSTFQGSYPLESSSCCKERIKICSVTAHGFEGQNQVWRSIMTISIRNNAIVVIREVKVIIIPCRADQPIARCDHLMMTLFLA